MLSVIMLSDVMLNVVSPIKEHKHQRLKRNSKYLGKRLTSENKHINHKRI